MKRLASLILVSLTLGGCAATRPAETPAVLRLAPAFDRQAALKTGSIAIAPVMSGGAVSERRLAYIDRGAPKELRQAASLFWDEPPPKLLEHALVAGLQARLSSVTGPEAGVPSDKRLVTRIQRFEEETGGGDPQAVVAFEATLIATGNRGILLTGRYCGQAAMAGTTPNQRAEAFEKAERAAVDRLAQDIASGRSAPGPGDC